MNNMIKKATVLIALAASLGLAGCGGDDSNAGGGDSVTNPLPDIAASGPACKLVTKGEAVGAVGGSADLRVANDAEDGCTYTTADGLKSVDVKFETMPFDANQVKEIRSMLEPAAITELSGMGDVAFAYQPTEQLTQVYVWGKGKFLEIFVGNSDGKTAEPAKKLTETAYSRL